MAGEGVRGSRLIDFGRKVTIFAIKKTKSRENLACLCLN